MWTNFRQMTLWDSCAVSGMIHKPLTESEAGADVDEDGYWTHTLRVPGLSVAARAEAEGRSRFLSLPSRRFAGARCRIALVIGTACVNGSIA